MLGIVFFRLVGVVVLGVGGCGLGYLGVVVVVCGRVSVFGWFKV